MKQHYCPGKNCDDSATVCHCKTDSLGHLNTYVIKKATVGVSLFAKSGKVTNNGTQSHCGTHAFSTKNKSFENVKPQFFLATRKISTEH